MQSERTAPIACRDARPRSRVRRRLPLHQPKREPAGAFGEPVIVTQRRPAGEAQLATGVTLSWCGPTPVFVLARVFAAHGGERRVGSGIGLVATAEISRSGR